jgi:hypothetical protein
MNIATEEVINAGVVITIQVQCAWCGAWIGEKAGIFAVDAISHGICDGCTLEMWR